MKQILQRFKNKKGSDAGLTQTTEPERDLARRVKSLYGVLSDLYGSDKIVLRAVKLNVLQMMRSESLPEQVLALRRLVFEDPTLEQLPDWEEIPVLLDQVAEALADIVARQTVEDDLERLINERMRQKHEDYVQEIKMQVVKEKGGIENPQTLKKLALLEKLDQKNITRSAMEVLRPAGLEEIVGQQNPVQSLLSKLASPLPQHILLYGPPGVGKTTAARLALAAARAVPYSSFDAEAPFVEVDGTTLRWDPRESVNPLLGSVHDPIYQGARRDLADSGVPEPKPGLVTDAHGGVLFIDEVGELDPILQSKLLKVLEDKRVFFESSYYDPNDTEIPRYIQKLFAEGAPADFILIGATTRDPDEINPALRSRCTEIFFEPLTPGDVRIIVQAAAQKLGVTLEDGVGEIISEYTMEGRRANNLLADAYALACFQCGKAQNISIRQAHVYEVIQMGRLTPHQHQRAADGGAIGRIYGLGVAGYIGSALEIEAMVFPARQKEGGLIRFNETAGSMARDSVFNAASVLRQLTGRDLYDYDVHVNVVGGGQIDGPSAGAAMLMAIYSALENKPIPQNIAVTGELSIQGHVKAVGGLPEKIYGAKQHGLTTAFVPRENQKDIPADTRGVAVIPVQTAEELLELIFSASPGTALA